VVLLGLPCFTGCCLGFGGGGFGRVLSRYNLAPDGELEGSFEYCVVRAATLPLAGNSEL